MAAAKIVSSVALLLAAGAEVASGFADARQADFERAQVETQAKAADAQAAAQKLERERELNSMLSTQRALFAARSLDPGSGSARAITRRETDLAEGDIRRIELNRQAKARVFGLQGQQLRAEARASRTGGILRGAGRLVGAAGRELERREALAEARRRRGGPD